MNTKSEATDKTTMLNKYIVGLALDGYNTKDEVKMCVKYIKCMSNTWPPLQTDRQRNGKSKTN